MSGSRYNPSVGRSAPCAGGAKSWLTGAAVAVAFSLLTGWLDVQDDAALDAATQASVRDAIERAQALDAERQAAQETHARRLAERAQDVAWAARSAP